jgi:type II secretory pathway predicted ATPase ExeA
MSRNSTSRLLVVTGASGVGKTAAVRLLDARRRPGLHCFYFDSIGIPSIEVMEREFGSGAQWQAHGRRVEQQTAQEAGLNALKVFLKGRLTGVRFCCFGTD